MLLIPEGEGQDLFFLFHPYPASQPKDIWNIHTGKKGGVAYPLFITAIHSTECSAVAVVAGGK